jgi:hypothetical protein
MRKKVLHTIGNFLRCILVHELHMAFQVPYVCDYIMELCILVHELHMAFQVPYVCDYIIELCRQQAEVIQNHENAIVRNIGRVEAQHRR